MRRILDFIYALIVPSTLLLTIAGCGGMGALRGTAVEKKPEGGEKAVPPAVEEEFPLEELLLPVIELEFFSLSLEYFDQFVWEANPAFPEYLFDALGEGDAGYSEGTGTVLVERDAGGQIVYLFKRGLLKKNPDGSRWWQVHQTSDEGEVFYELLASPEGLPLKIRFQHPDSGERVEIVPENVAAYRSAKREDSAGRLKARLGAERASEVAHLRETLFHSPEVLAREKATTAAGSFRTFHLRDRFPEGDLLADYWISPGTPGGVVNILYRTLGGETLSAVELVSARESVAPRFGPLD